MISETDRINHVGLKTKGILRVASTENFEDFKGFSVLNRFSKTLIADIECSVSFIRVSSIRVDFGQYSRFWGN